MGHEIYWYKTNFWFSMFGVRKRSRGRVSAFKGPAKQVLTSGTLSCLCNYVLVLSGGTKASGWQVSHTQPTQE